VAPLSKQKCLATAGIYSAISSPLSDAMEDCSVVGVQGLQMRKNMKLK